MSEELESIPTEPTTRTPAEGAAPETESTDQAATPEPGEAEPETPAE
jgi:hypothetical protein